MFRQRLYLPFCRNCFSSLTTSVTHLYPFVYNWPLKGSPRVQTNYDFTDECYGMYTTWRIQKYCKLSINAFCFSLFSHVFFTYSLAQFRNNSIRNLKMHRPLISVPTDSLHCVTSHGHLTYTTGNKWFPGDTWSNPAQDAWLGNSSAQIHEGSTVGTNGTPSSVIVYITKFSTLPV
jgi:hypothetical protein